MEKELKIDEKLASGNKGSLPFPKMGTKNLLVIGEVQSTGLSTVLGSKGSSAPLNLGLNFHSFLGEV